MLLSGANGLSLLDVATGTLSPLVEGGSSDAQTFLPSGTAVSFARGNDLYTARIIDGHVERFTFDGSETMYNGTLDWVYNEEIAIRTAQLAYSWSPDGRWFLLMRSDDAPVASYPIESFETDPPTAFSTPWSTWTSRTRWMKSMNSRMRMATKFRAATTPASGRGIVCGSLTPSPGWARNAIRN
jgi:hypothetical protein